MNDPIGVLLAVLWGLPYLLPFLLRELWPLTLLFVCSIVLVCARAIPKTPNGKNRVTWFVCGVSIVLAGTMRGTYTMITEEGFCEVKTPEIRLEN